MSSAFYLIYCNILIVTYLFYNLKDFTGDFMWKHTRLLSYKI